MVWLDKANTNNINVAESRRFRCGTFSGTFIMMTRKRCGPLKYIVDHLVQPDLPPSGDEMKDGLNSGSKSGLHHFASSSEELGYPARRPHRAQAPDNMVPSGTAVPAETETAQGFLPDVARDGCMLLLSGVRTVTDAGTVELPLYGCVALGDTMATMLDTSRPIEVPSSLLGPGEHFALEVSGDSMNEAGIMDGDMAIILKSEDVEDGQIAAVLVDDTEVTLKRLRYWGDLIALESCNVRYQGRILTADRVKVQGRIVGLLRKY